MSRERSRRIAVLAVAALTLGSLVPRVAEGDLLGGAVGPATQPEESDNLALANQLLAIAHDASLSPTERTLQAAEAAIADRRALVTDPDALTALARLDGDVALSRALLAASGASGLERALNATDAALASRMQLAQQGALGPRGPALVAQEQEDVAAARAILASTPTDGSFAGAVALARASLEAQATALGLALQPAPALPAHDAPSAAAQAVLALYGAAPNATESAAIAKLDDLPAKQRDALTATIDAFLRYDAAGRAAYANVNLTRLERATADAPLPLDLLRAEQDAAMQHGTADVPAMDALQATPVRGLGDALAAAGVQLGPLLSARLDLLNSTIALHDAFVSPVPSGVFPAISVPPALAVDVNTEDNTYSVPLALLVDLGGDDTYLNNAGGSNLGVACGLGSGFEPAALIDLGGGNDTYQSPLACGANGGGYLGAGFLVDDGGNDSFSLAPGAFASGAAPTATAQVLQPNHAPGAYDDPGRFVVGYSSDPGVAPGSTWHGAQVLRQDATLGFLVVNASDPAGFVAAAQADPAVAYVQRDALERVEGFQPNDTLYAQQYAPAHVDAPAAWSTSVGSTAKSICIVDTGVDTEHEDLAGSTRYLGGYDFADARSDASDDYGHGTHVAGIALATIDNGLGIAGMAQASYLSAKVIDHTGLGWASDLASGIEWCADHGGNVITMSLGSTVDSTPVDEAASYAWGKGSLLVASAGNTGCSAPSTDCITYPANNANVIAVTCSDAEDYLCAYSSYGVKAELAAPGDKVLSTMMPCSTGVTLCNDTGYGLLSGTSMSAPHVAGIAALVWSQAPNLTNGQLRQLLRNHARDGSTVGCDMDFGHGIVDAAATLQAALAGERPAFTGSETCDAPRVPASPTQLLATGGGVNGGAGFAGLGFLLDAGGATSYQAGDRGVNGGGFGEGIGMLVDGGGNDSFVGGREGVNGGGSTGAGFLVDAGGNGTFQARGVGTNGGGSTSYYDQLYAGSPYGQLLFTDGAPTGSGFLLDGAGSASFDAPTGDSGVNGGGSYGVGFLLDAGGTDTYQAWAGGANGGALAAGIGTLVDGGGVGRFVAHQGAVGGYGSNGGAMGGVGVLVDGGGNNSFDSIVDGVNGAALQADAAGLLADLGPGSDTFAACVVGNGAARGGPGFLLHGGGGDRYQEESPYCPPGAAYDLNGAGAFKYPGPGFVFDAGGNDTYDGGPDSNGGGGSGPGMLLDGGGNDSFVGGDDSNGAGAGPLGIAFLVAGGGNDSYSGGDNANGGGDALGLGFLFDGGGNGTYVGRGLGSNGGGSAGRGFLLSAGGSNTYVAGDRGTNGGAATLSLANVGSTTTVTAPGLGFLMSAGSGDDRYQAGALGTDGGSAGGVGLLIDRGDHATFADADGGSGVDRTKAPKGEGGVQIHEPVQGWPESTGVPDAPKGVLAVAPDPREILVNWTLPDHDGSAPITGFQLYRDGALLASLGSSNRSFADETVVPHELAVYEVTALNAWGEGPAGVAHARVPRCARVGPDAFGETCAEIPFAWTNMAGATTLSFPASKAANDVSSETTVPLGFAFPWGGANYTSVDVRTNGMVCFGTCYHVQGFDAPILPSAAPAPGTLSGFVACNWFLQEVDYSVTVTTLALPHGLAIQWNVPKTTGLGDLHFQEVLLDSGEVDCEIQHVALDAQTLAPPAIAAQDAAGGGGLTYRADFFALDDVGVRFAPIPNLPPTAAGSATPLVTTGVAPVAFTDASTDPEDGLVAWSWDFGDGASWSSDVGGDATHLYTLRGVYPARLTVTDDASQTSTALVANVTMDHPPTIPPLATQVVATDVNDSIALGGADVDNDPLNYTASPLPSGATLDASAGVIHWRPTDAQQGTYTLAVGVTDGVLSASGELTLLVTGVAADMGGDRIVDVGVSAPFSATRSASAYPIVDDAWDFGDGTAVQHGTVVTHTFGAVGSYVATLTVTDSAGRTGVARANVTVSYHHAVSLAAGAPTTLVFVPGATQVVPLTVANQGNGVDDVAVSLAGVPSGWTASLTPQGPFSLAPGASQDVTLALRAPAGASSTQAARVVAWASSEDRDVTASVPFDARVPLVVSLALGASYAPTDPVVLRAHAAWADGSPAPGVTIRVAVDWYPGLPGVLAGPLFPRAAPAASGATGSGGDAAVLLPSDEARADASQACAAPALPQYACLNGPGAHVVRVDAVDGQHEWVGTMEFDVG